MRPLELKLIAELMKNSQRSDRELAKLLGVSQPTISRTKNRLEKQGYIREYTIMPDFHKLGYEIMAFTFFKLNKDVDPKEVDSIRQKGLKMAKQSPLEVILVERGMGLGFSVVSVSLHENYNAYRQFKEWLKQFKFLQVDEIQSFLVSLHDEIHYLYLTLSKLAEHAVAKGSAKSQEEQTRPE